MEHKLRVIKFALLRSNPQSVDKEIVKKKASTLMSNPTRKTLNSIVSCEIFPFRPIQFPQLLLEVSSVLQFLKARNTFHSVEGILGRVLVGVLV